MRRFCLREGGGGLRRVTEGGGRGRRDTRRDTASRATRARRAAGEGRDVPEMACREGVANTGEHCGQPAGVVARIEGMGPIPVCGKCAKFCADKSPFELPRDLGVLVGNLRDQARTALRAVEAPREG